MATATSALSSLRVVSRLDFTGLTDAILGLAERTHLCC